MGQQIEMGTNDENGYPVLMSAVRIPIDKNLSIDKDIIKDDMNLFKYYGIQEESVKDKRH